MTVYRHLLVAVEIHDSGKQILQRAQALAKSFDAHLTVVHVVEYLPVDPAGDALLTTPVDLSGERTEQAKDQLGSYCDELGIPREQLRVVVGAVTGEILRLQKELVADLIVIGHHPRSGLSALFSHTDDGVLTRACCDVLALNLDC